MTTAWLIKGSKGSWQKVVRPVGRGCSTSQRCKTCKCPVWASTERTTPGNKARNETRARLSKTLDVIGAGSQEEALGTWSTRVTHVGRDYPKYWTANSVLKHFYFAVTYIWKSATKFLFPTPTILSVNVV